MTLWKQDCLSRELTRIRLLNLIWLMTLVALMAMNSYYIFSDVVDRIANVNTLMIIAVFCFSATTFMVPR